MLYFYVKLYSEVEIVPLELKVLSFTKHDNFELTFGLLIP